MKSPELEFRIQFLVRYGEEHIREVFGKLVAMGAKRPAVLLRLKDEPEILGVNLDDDVDMKAWLPVIIEDADGKYIGTIGLDRPS